MAEACTSLSKIYFRINRPDSAYHYAAFVLSNDPGSFYKLGIVNASDLLEQYLKEKAYWTAPCFTINFPPQPGRKY
jgi:hypothetical protein